MTVKIMSDSPGDYLTFDQIKKYAEDLAVVYGSEKEKRKALEAANRQLIKFAEDLNSTISDLRLAHRELEEAYLDTIQRLALAAEYKDKETGKHIIRMSRYSALIAEKLGLPSKEVQNILYASPMHDVGKIGIPESILLKNGKLTEKEYEIMKTHTTIGATILAQSNAEILRNAQEIALSHHEKWNGEGYPKGLSKEQIPLAGRIVAVADIFDVLTTRRPYKDPYPVQVACNIISAGRGEGFDPKVVDVFMEKLNEILMIKKEVGVDENVSLSDFALSARDQERERIQELG